MRSQALEPSQNNAPTSKRKKRPAPFSLRLTENERAVLERKAGALPLAAYVKSVVLDEKAPRYRKRRRAPEADQQLLAHILARLGASDTHRNLQQIAQAVQDGTLLLDDDTHASLTVAIAEVAWMRVTLMQALGLKTTDTAGEHLEERS
ncbi:hypothetical protein [Pseudaestuariivita rosea]|uniref:hypothetical protein n=1 Tax=Pseudaestuariivita rosea TaxID=2763263 RepID=UPI001F3A7727|nr:hypothetical protein [Pseudaestuariivita rosea]